jgi:hypothetical protein
MQHYQTDLTKIVTSDFFCTYGSGDVYTAEVQEKIIYASVWYNICTASSSTAILVFRRVF